MADETIKYFQCIKCEEETIHIEVPVMWHREQGQEPDKVWECTKCHNMGQLMKVECFVTYPMSDETVRYIHPMEHIGYSGRF
ncbi:hypothetical protein LCGC14_2076700 [marine sediment metagenome]|uniref:Uncharacterized protein n=1 Tax=marine sediment metagenome TaxID=412755 RepID=A0A0F9GV92_9ZZZZ